MKTNYLNLAIGAPKRLAILKRDAEQFAVKYPHIIESKTWRNMRYGNLRSTSTLDNGIDNGKQIWYSHAGEQFRNERDCTDISRRDYNGWYTDVHQYDTAIGIVAGLPHGKFLSGYRWTSNDERVYFSDIFEDESDAANMADEHARVFSEACMEDSYKFEECRKLENEEEEAIERLQECLALRHCDKLSKDYAEEAKKIVERIREIRASLKADYSEFR